MIIANIKSFSHFKEIKDLCDGVILTSKYSISSNPRFSNEEIDEVIEYANEIDKLVIIDISSLMTNEEIDNIDSFISIYKDKNANFLYTDIGVYNVLKKYNIQNKGIYDPKTLITNSYDMNLYLDNGILAIGLSNEIPADTIKEIDSKKRGKTLIKVFGYHQMFYSKRHLISTYHEYKNINMPIDRLNTYIKEETRGEEYHIDESEYGTVIYRSYPISYMKVLDKVSNVDFLVLDSSFIEEALFNKALAIYNDVLKGKLDKDSASSQLLEMFKIEDGFIYNDTVYVKEEGSR